MQSSSECDPVSRARVLVISDNKAFIEIAERDLILAGGGRVFVAQNALLGLRISCQSIRRTTQFSERRTYRVHQE